MKKYLAPILMLLIFEAVAVSLWLAFPKADKAEHVIQKATELGAAELVFFPSRYCVSRPEGKALDKKLERWQKIARSAAEQSGRGVIPAVRAADSFRDALLTLLPDADYQFLQSDGLPAEDGIRLAMKMADNLVTTQSEG